MNVFFIFALLNVSKYKAMKFGVLFFSIVFIFFSTGEKTLGQSSPDKLVNLCVQESGSDATYLKDYVVKLPKATRPDNPPVARHTLALHKNIHYRFTICNSEKYPGKGISRIYDTKGMIATNFSKKSDKIYNSVDFFCKKSGPYTVYISFKDGKPGMAVSILSYVKK